MEGKGFELEAVCFEPEGTIFELEDGVSAPEGNVSQLETAVSALEGVSGKLEDHSFEREAFIFEPEDIRSRKLPSCELRGGEVRASDHGGLIKCDVIWVGEVLRRLRDSG